MENEISNIRTDLVKFLEWAKQSQESSQRNFSILAENFNILLEFLISKNGAENLNLHHSASPCANVEVEKTKSELECSSSIPSKVFIDFSHDKDLENSLRIHPISLEILSLNIEKSTDKEKEIGSTGKDSTAAVKDWVKQSSECNQKNLSVLNENFNLLPKLFIPVSKIDAPEFGHLNSQHAAVTNKSGKKPEKSDRQAVPSMHALPLAVYEGVKDFSDDEDLEDSLRINPISLNMFYKATDKIKGTKSLTKEHKDEKITSETIENTIHTKSWLIDGDTRCAPVKFSGKKFEQNLRTLKKKYDYVCKKLPNAMKVPDTYLEYGAARGWTMNKIRSKFRKKQNSVGRMPTLNIIKKTWLEKEDVHKHSRSSPILNLTPEQFEANVKTLQEEYKKSNRRSAISDFYFEFGAARGWNLKQVIKKYYVWRSDSNRMKRYQIQM